MVTRAIEVMRRFDAAELSLCVQVNRACARPGVREFFRVISRLGDGLFWYALMLALPLLYGDTGRQAALQMVVTGVVGVALYKGLKHTLVRERPFISDTRISLGMAPLDRYSFPSGHTLHAVSFTILASAYFPELAIVLVPFAALVAASRVILGLHYPTDVLAGALLGTVLSTLSLYLFGV
jgi:undecaprenyl-diphosphatase